MPSFAGQVITYTHLMHHIDSIILHHTVKNLAYQVLKIHKYFIIKIFATQWITCNNSGNFKWLEEAM